MFTQTVLREKTTTISIGICATTEIENTLRLVEQIRNLDDPKVRAVQVLVATPNRWLASELSARHSPVTVLLEEKREGKISALNRIIHEATGDILVLACADIKIARNAIPNLVKDLVEHPECGAADSIVELINGDELMMDRVSNVVWETHNATLDDLDAYGHLGQIAGNLIAVRRELIEKLPQVINDDAYIALRICERGFQIRRTYSARIWISGPRTPTDYLFQRSRVLQGHLQLIRRLGKMPTTFEFQVLTRPQRYFMLLARTIARLGSSHLSSLMVAGFLEVLSFQVAIISSLVRHDRRSWRIAETTKNV